MSSNNIFALLDNEDGAPSSGAGKKAAAKKPAAAGASAAGKKALPAHSFPGEQPAGAQKPAARVPKAEKDHHVTSGGARGGRGGSFAGRGGRGGRAAAVGEDHSRREFDRRGAPQKHAPRHAHKDGAGLGPEGGAAGVVHQGESVEEAVAPEEVIEDVEVIEEVADDDDGSQTYEQFLAAKEAKRVQEDSEREIRAVEIDESAFNKVKPLVREGAEEDAAAAEAEAERIAARKAAKEAKKQRSANVINVDEFRGGREADSKYKAPYIGGATRGGFDSARGGRGGFVSRGGAAAAGSSACYSCGQEGHRSFECPSKEGGAPAGGRGGARGGRGGRGGFSARDGADASAAPAADGAAPAAAEAGAVRGGRGGARGGRGGAAGACYGCGQEGHRAADCPTKESNPAPRGRGGFAPRGGRGGFAPRGGRGGFVAGGAGVPINDKNAFPALA